MKTRNLVIRISQFIIPLFLCVGCQTDGAEQKPQTSVADLQKSAMQTYMNSPIDAIPMMAELAGRYEESKDHKQAASTYLNVASIYDESLNQKDSALIFAEKGLVASKNSKDEKQQASLLKYIGYLKGLSGQTKEGKQDLVQAVMKYKSQKDMKGVALSHFNLARVFYVEGGLDESEHFLSKSTKFWRQEKDNSKIFFNNLFAISLFQQMGIESKVDAVVKENNKLKSDIKYEGYAKEEFERLLAEIKKKRKK